MIPLLLALSGVVALVAGGLVLGRMGPGLRVGRILATTPIVPLPEAIAAAGRPRYLGVRGRIDADDEFLDEAERPLVFRRKRFVAERRGGWQAFREERQAVPFRIDEGLDSIAVDADVLGDGVVVVRREAVGSAGDLGAERPADLAPETPVKLVVEQLSSVEHAVVLGVPVVDRGGGVTLTAGLGRPLIVTTLEIPQAIRMLGGGRQGPARLAAGLLGLGLTLLALALATAVVGALLAVVAPPVALGVEPTATPSTGGDPRSAGEGPGLVGAPFLAIGAVLGLGLLALAATLAYVRLTGGPRPVDDARAGRDAGRGGGRLDGEGPITRR